MKKLDLENVAEVSEGTLRRNPPAGAYICSIWTVEDVPDKEYLRISFDIAEGDYKNFGMNMMERYGFNPLRMVKSYKQKSLGFFKRFISAVTASNPGFKWADDENALIGKKIGVVLGEEEYRKRTGEIAVRLYAERELPVAKVKAGDFTIPDLKKLPWNDVPPPTNAAVRIDADVEDVF